MSEAEATYWQNKCFEREMDIDRLRYDLDQTEAALSYAEAMKEQYRECVRFLLFGRGRSL